MRLIVRIPRRDGSVRESQHDGAATVGRAPANAVVLSGLRVAAQHLRLTALAADRLGVECLSSIGVRLNGGPVVTGAFEARVGDSLEVGSWRLTVQAAESGDALRVLATDIGNADGLQRSRLSLDDTGLRMRRPALIGAVAVLLLALLLPLLFRALPLPASVARLLPTERLWSSGPLSHAHRHLQDRCDSCHDTLFVAVRDSSCLSCHGGIRHHMADAGLLKDTGLDSSRCASCHLEHGGPHAVLPAHPATCTDCHGSETRSRQWQLGGAALDFADRHPAFRPTVNHRDPATGAWSAQRLAPDAPARDDPGLKFPHDLHLDPAGIRGANGREVLQCASCHAAARGEPGFPAIRYETHCQSCHALKLETAAGPLTVPHGDLATARALLQPAFDKGLLARPELPEPAARRRPGEQAERDLDTRAATGTVGDLIERGLCGTCHAFSPRPDGVAELIKPRLRSSWLVHAQFSHAPHQWVACKDCHGAEQSSHAEDLLLPTMAGCQSCHGGAGDDRRIPSTCIDCHRFHQAEGPVMGPAPRPAATAATPADAPPAAPADAAAPVGAEAKAGAGGTALPADGG